MKKLSYRIGDLFDVKDVNAILLHACNCKGVWGSGIAAEFKRRFPAAFKEYNDLCYRYGKQLLGRGILSLVDFKAIVEGGTSQRIANLFTSDGYGADKDSPNKILKNTEKAVKSLFAVLKDGAEIHSPKINAGLFAVPWDKTEAIIEECMKPRKIKWTVWSLK